MTLGAAGPIFSRATGLPDWMIRVSSSCRSLSVLTMAAWAEGPAVKASMNLSAAEFKWFVKMFTDFAAQDAAAQAAFEAEALSEKAGVEDDDAEDIVVIDEEDEEDDEVDAPAAPAAPAAE